MTSNIKGRFISFKRFEIHDGDGIRTTMFFWLRRSNCPMFDPMAAPVDTEGPSNPTEPPKPTVKELVIIEAKVLYGFTAPLFF